MCGRSCNSIDYPCRDFAPSKVKNMNVKVCN